MGEEELNKIANAIIDGTDAEWHTADAIEKVRAAIIEALQAAYSAGVHDGIADSGR